MDGDNLDRAREQADEAVRELARYPSPRNSSKAQRALQRLRQLARKATRQRVREEQTHLADRIRRSHRQ